MSYCVDTSNEGRCCLSPCQVTNKHVLFLISSDLAVESLIEIDPQTLTHSIMYCLQWMLPILVLPKPLNPALCFHHSMFMVLYLLDFFLSRKPCTICSAVFIIALTLLCYSGMPGCIFSTLCVE